MRVVADTNIIVSGLLWFGPPRRILDAARAGKIVLFTTRGLLVELKEVLRREKLARRMHLVGAKPYELFVGVASLAKLLTSETIPPTILDDPPDDEVLGCAVAAKADFIVSGNSHLLSLKEYRGIPIVTASAFLARISP